MCSEFCKEQRQDWKFPVSSAHSMQILYSQAPNMLEMEKDSFSLCKK